MLDKRPETFSTSMKTSSGVRTVEHSYEHDYSPKVQVKSFIEPQDAEKQEMLLKLQAAFPGFSPQSIAAALEEADADVNAAAELLATRQPESEAVNSTGLQGRKGPVANVEGNGCRRMPRPDALTEPDNLISGTSDRPSCWTGSVVVRENHGDETMVAKKTKMQKKRRGGAKLEELEPKDAAARRAVEKFLLSMLGEEFNIGQAVVRDVLDFFQGDTQKSLDTLLNMASTTSGHVSSNDQQGSSVEESSISADAEADAMDNSLLSLMEVFPDVDPALVVMAFQKHNGDLEKISNALLLDGQAVPEHSGHQKGLAKVGDSDHSEKRVILAQLNRLFPVVDSNFLWEVLKTTNFILRDAHQVLFSAGFAPTSERSECSVPQAVQRKVLPPVVKTLHKDSDNQTISTEPRVLQGAWVKIKPLDTPGRKKLIATGVEGGALSTVDSVRKNIAIHSHNFEGNVGADDYNSHRHCAKENWSTMQNYFREAASAYSRGQRSYASVLSEKGKYHKKLAQEADERASLRIFADRNRNIENNITIDLHNQHVLEAIQVLKLHLRSLSPILSVHTLTVITGYGFHSSDGRGRIKSAVVSFLTRKGIDWKESNPGCIIIMLKHARKIFKDDESSSECY
ncbi:SMR domain-containing protein At5g58720 isoform X1 [Physcomitrium patens]|uniref:Smr domain-containing protein n=1 Tax=Physcomitrium patens TaxID=3218 RepID=A0A2K1JDB6_PHYPA|nr:uncharacterized protein LOC112292753 isoform X1 [Physcomitrium patens]XP_024397322.1 uncharacterized protein LOC112292753 isoform X1 [Physcomitrium patens]PNR39508.1 hypothetical protein PHYPA_019786 [Physcomitrium patens]|eukprot:XP_024397321.1 uncharacterized protein LOC112292753 isoform X1 [Physcomitrella patens]